jgi:hypothetical protein
MDVVANRLPIGKELSMLTALLPSADTTDLTALPHKTHGYGTPSPGAERS